MFDVAVTGKPLLFCTYDMDRYRDELRGSSFDLTAEPPGPVVPTTDALVQRLADLDGVVAEHVDAYACFRERSCHLDDGGATERFLQRLLTLPAWTARQGLVAPSPAPAGATTA